MIEWQEFHFLRPWWILALVPLAIVIYFLVVWRMKSKWEQYCDSHLLKKILHGQKVKNSYTMVWLIALSWLMAIIALAGPTWKKIPVPVYHSKLARIIVLDLSLSMAAQDLSPNRLARAKIKVIQTLERSKKQLTALVVFAGEPFVVTPLTSDVNNIVSVLRSLDISLMPVQGSGVHLALQKAYELFEQGGVNRGDIVLLTDGMSAPEAAYKVAQKIKSSGFRLWIIATGTASGAPVKLKGGEILKDRSGTVIVPGVPLKPLQKLALFGGGKAVYISADEGDLDQIMTGKALSPINPSITDRKGDVWREEGHWLILPLLILMLFVFRRGVIPLILLSVLSTPPVHAVDWESWWYTANQKGARAMKKHDYAKAAKLFNDPNWKAVALYYQGKYIQAANLLRYKIDPISKYNLGNALAKAGKFVQAIEAYDQCLQLQPNHKNAQFNRNLLLKILSKSDKKKQFQKTKNQNAESQKNKEKKVGDNNQQNVDSEARGQQGNESQQQQKSQTSAAESETENKKQKNPQQKENRGKAEDEKDMQLTSTEAKNIKQWRTIQQYINQVQDDPSRLWREKFKRKYQRRNRSMMGQGPKW